MRVREATWAAQVPWSGVQDRPASLDDPNGIPISAVDGLQQALDSKANKGSIPSTIAWTNVTGKPDFGSAAYVNVDAFVAAPTAKTLQTGLVDLVATQQSYAVVFTATMKAVPKIYLQYQMADGSGDMLFTALQADSVTTTGFTFWLSGAPTLSTGKVRYRAIVEDQP